MKKILLLFLALALQFSASAQTSNAVWLAIYPKVAVQTDTNMNLTANGNPLPQATVSVTNPVALAYGSAPTVTNLGNGIMAVFQFGIPSGSPGSPGTNTITAYNLSNAMFSSSSITLLDTNFNFATSNYLGRFTNVLSVRVTPPQSGGGGLAPATNVNFWTWFSTNSGTSWATNYPNSSTNITQIAITAAGTGAGAVKIFTSEHPELEKRNNDLTRQVLSVADPVNNSDAATKRYVDVTAANVAGSLWQFGTNGSYFYGPNNSPVFELYQSALLFATNCSIAIDGTGTNWALSLAVTNFVAGWQLQMSPDLALNNGFSAFSSYTLTTNAGIATFTIPMYLTPANMAFFRIASPQTAGITAKAPLTVTAGTIYTSNTWNLVTITNGLKSGDIITVNSNGLKLVDVWISNSVPVFKPHW